jgi:hypothetical protein
MNVNIYVNVGEETRERRGDLGRLGLLVTRKKSRQIWRAIYLYVYIYIFFLKYKNKDQKDQKTL